MLKAITILLVYQLVGEVITQAFGLPIPGPVIGMVLLFVTLVLRGGPDRELRDTSRQLLQYLSMLFIPAGAGIMLHFGTLQNEWLPILLTATLGTMLVIAISAKLLQYLIAREVPVFSRSETRSPGNPSDDSPGDARGIHHVPGQQASPAKNGTAVSAEKSTDKPTSHEDAGGQSS